MNGKAMTMTHHDGHKSILCTNKTLISIRVDPERESAKIDLYPLYFYFNSLDEARDLRDMLNELLDLAPTIKPHVPRHSSAVYTGPGEKKK